MSESSVTPEETTDIPSHLTEFAQDYACYLRVHAENERQTFNNSIDEMLTKLEEFGGLVDTIRSDTSSCLDKQIPDIEAKCGNIKQIFARVDQLEKFISIVRRDVNAMEECVNKAESEMSTFTSFKKMFSSLVGSKKSSQNKEERYEYVAPDIFVTENYLKPAPVIEATENTESATSDVKDTTNTVSENT